MNKDVTYSNYFSYNCHENTNTVLTKNIKAMQINLKELGTQAIENTTGTKKMRLSANATSMVFQLFTKNIYSNPIGTVVREIASNCFDSHIEAKVDAPVLIRKFKDPQTDTLYISFIDYGVGMSPDRVENIYGVYFESTKRIDNTQIGGFGIGGKTPLAYKRSTGFGEGEYDNSFYVITRYEGIEYSYLIFEGAESPEITLLHSEPTTERNGTEVRVPVLEKDLQSFGKEMVRQLYYFENVVFEGFDDDYRHGETLMNEYQIVRGKNFLFRGSEYGDYAHVCLGRVAYPIDYNVLGLNSQDYRLPLAVRLEVGEIGVVASREQLDYSESTIKTLKKKLEKAKTEIGEMLAKQYNDIVTLEQYFNVKNDFGKLQFSNGQSMYVGNLIKQSDIDFSNFKYQFMKMPNDKQLFRLFFDVNTYGKKPSRSRYSSKYEFDGGYKELSSNGNLLYITGEFTRKVIKQAYLKAQLGMYHIISTRNMCNSLLSTEIAELFNVHMTKFVDDNGKPVAFVQSLIDMQEEYFSIVHNHAEDYDTLVVPDDFVIARKNKDVLSPEVRNTTIPVKFEGSYSKHRIKLDVLFKYNSPIFWGTAEDSTKIENAYNLYCTLFDSSNVVSYYSDYDNTLNHRGQSRGTKKTSKASIMFIQLAVGNVKYMQYCKKAYHINDFFLKMLYRKEDLVKQYFQTYTLIQKYGNLKSLYKDDNFSLIDGKTGVKIRALKKQIEAIPEKAQDESIGRYKYLLEKFFDLSNIKMTKEQEAISKRIDELYALQRVNEEILRCLNMPYELERADKVLLGILQKVMVF